jgi:hypothetical protein
MSKKHTPRGPNKPKPITTARKLVSRAEAMEMLGCCLHTLKRLEERFGGPLKVIRLTPTARVVFYRIEQINALIEGAVSDAAAA